LADDSNLGDVFDEVAGALATSCAVDAEVIRADVEWAVHAEMVLVALVAADNNGDAVEDNACRVQVAALAAVARAVAAAAGNRPDAASDADNSRQIDDGSVGVVEALVA
jgi:hypothetical protein